MSVWIELISAGVSAVAAGAEVFANRTKKLEKRLETNPKEVWEGDDTQKQELRDIANPERPESGT